MIKYKQDAINLQILPIPAERKYWRRSSLDGVYYLEIYSK